MVATCRAYTSQPDVLWRLLERMAKYAATGYLEVSATDHIIRRRGKAGLRTHDTPLSVCPTIAGSMLEALELGAHGACEDIIAFVRLTLAAENGLELGDATSSVGGGPAASGGSSLSSAHSSVKRLTLQRTKVLAASCKVASLLCARATNSIRFGIGGAVEACNVLRQCVHWATADGTCVLCKEALRWCLSAVSILAHSARNRDSMRAAGAAKLMPLLRSEITKLRKK